MSLSEEIVRSAWRNLFGSRGTPELDRIVQHYGEEHRAYHNLEHIAAVLRFIAEYEHRSPELILAAILHDVVYDPRAKDNEAKSAEFAREILGRLDWSTSTIDRVAALILATKSHEAPEGDTIAALLIDADLAILGAPPRLYDLYAKSIREEYGFVSDADYREGRTKVLRSLLDRPRLFKLADNLETYETIARANMAREISALKENVHLP